MKGRGHCKLYNSNQRMCHSPHPTTLGNFSLTLVQNDFQKNKWHSKIFHAYIYIFYLYNLHIFDSKWPSVLYVVEKYSISWRSRYIFEIWYDGDAMNTNAAVSSNFSIQCWKTKMQMILYRFMLTIAIQKVQ